MNALPQYAIYPKKCPKCKGLLQVINKKQTGTLDQYRKRQQFIGCANWPRCNHREELTEAKAQEIEANIPQILMEII